MERVLFIINPKSGTKRSKLIQNLASKHLHSDSFEVDFKETEYAGHAIEICKTAKNEYDIIVAVGGDGTIHEIAQQLIHSHAKLAIIPMGSGNGFARFMRIPLHAEKAVKHIATAQAQKVDAILCNNEYFINMAGIGFDAIIGHAFVSHPKRGGFSYLPLILRLIRNYKPIELSYSCNGNTFTQKAFLASIANSSQWGMNAHIAPKAKINDGKFRFVILKPFPIISSISLASRIFSKTIHRSRFAETITLENLRFETEETFIMHLDGEPREIQGPIDFQIHKQSLWVLS